MIFDKLAKLYPDRPAVICSETGASLSFDELNLYSKKLSRLFYDFGLRFSDHVAIMMENNLNYLVVCSAALRTGLQITPINWHLEADEAAYIVNDCDAKVLISSSTLKCKIDEMTESMSIDLRKLVLGNSPDADDSLADLTKNITPYPQEELEGTFMFYSSGTTGRPKGIVQPLSRKPLDDDLDMKTSLVGSLFQLNEESVYLTPAPLYHAAPAQWSMMALKLGATVVVMKQFDPKNTLSAIEKYRVTHAQFAPTMFVRLLNLPDDIRKKADTGSLKVVLHSAAPCPVDVKWNMLDWWGDIIYEYYSGSEDAGSTLVGPEDWKAKPGTVGKPLTGKIHILDENGVELPAGEVGTVYFEANAEFKYHGDEEKTKDSYTKEGWNTLGDLGYLDGDGFLFLTDRKSDMIIAGGVNIYPQEAENILITHPKIFDVAVIGIPNKEYGEEVKAIVSLKERIENENAMEEEIINYCRERLSKFKCPRSVDFVDDIPRLESGKLLRRKLKDLYN